MLKHRTNLEKKESGIHIRVCLEVLNLQQEDTAGHFYYHCLIIIKGRGVNLVHNWLE